MVTSARIDIAEIYAPFTHQQLILTEAIGLRLVDESQSVGRRPGRQPDVLGRTGTHRFRRAAHLRRFRAARPGACHERPCAATESRRRSGREVTRWHGTSKNLAAVLGTGQTKYVAKRNDVSMNGLVREAIDRALADSGSTFDDIDAVVVGKAPDFFEGVMMPELFMADATGATNKPLIRVHTAGSVGGSTAIVAASLVQSGKYKRVLTMAWEKQSESNAMWALSIPVPFTKPVGAGAGGYFAPHVRAYIRRSGAPNHIGAMVAVKDRLNGAKNPLAHLHQPDITLEKVMASPMLWDPIRYDETCPSSDGAAAMVIGNEEAAEARVVERATPWPGSTPPRCAPNRWPTRVAIRSTRRPAATRPRRCGAMPASPAPSTRSTPPRCTCRSRGTSRCGWRIWASRAEGEGWKLTEAGETAIGGQIPFNAVRRCAVAATRSALRA